MNRLRELLSAAAVFVAISAQTPAPDVSSRITVVVEGQQLKTDDVKALFAGIYEMKAVLVERRPGEMPSYDALVHYAGRSSTLPAKPMIWYSNENRLATSDAEQAAIGAATTAAFVAAELDFGLAGPTLESLYAKASTQQERLALAATVAQALAQSSDAARTSAESKTEQIRTQIVPGVSRTDVYAALRTLGLTAFNNAFILGKSRTESSDGNAIEVCDTSDDAAAKWPYQNEPAPKNDGACAALTTVATANPDAYVAIWGAFSLVPACGGRTQITFAFDSNDRVKTVTIDGPHDICV